MNAALADITELADGTRVALCKGCGYSASGPRPQRAHLCPAAVFGRPCGPGCQLRRSLAWWGIHDNGSCGCTEFSSQMDAWGQDCWAHLEEIVEHLRGAAAAKGLPFLATAARIMVGRAIDAAKQEQAHGQKAEAETRASDVGRAQ
jgi:hypothetical protein